MNIIESIGVALSSLWANKMRSFLTMLGIIIGIASVIAIVAIGQGSKATIGKEFQKFGANRVYISINWGENPEYRDRFDDSDVETIRRVFKDEIKALSPVSSRNGDAINGRNNESIYVNGVNETYNKIENMDILKGRFILKSDVMGRRDICVIENSLAFDLFQRTNVIGEEVKLDTGSSTHSFIIGGVFKKPESSLGKLTQNMGKSPRAVYIPVTTMKKIGMPDRYYGLEANITKGKNIDGVCKNMIDVIEKRHRNSGENFYRYQSAKGQMQMMDNILGIISKVIAAIAAISLLVGGIGVMNIMLVSVTERTREIGIRKSIGARRKDIMLQFLIEAMIISGIGGIIGTVIGLSLATGFAIFMEIPPVITFFPVVIAIVFSAAVGIFFGMYPANKAAKMDPIESLRYE